MSQLDDLIALFSPTAQADATKPPRYKSREKTVIMSIDDFLALAAPLPHPEIDKLKGITNAVRSGTLLESLPHLSFDRRGKVTGHEGRHRALYFRGQGHTHMPVVLVGDIRWSEQNDPNSFDYVKDWPTHLLGEGKKRTRIPFPVERKDAALAAVRTNPPATSRGYGKSFRIMSPVGPVYRVDGAKVRRKHVDVIGGAHRLVPYAFVPGNEVWIEKLVGGPNEERYILAHEMTEILLMKVRKWSYERAHAAANRVERSLRKGGDPAKVFSRFMQKHFPRALSRSGIMVGAALLEAYLDYR